MNLNPTANTWYVLTVAWNGTPEASYHLENPAPPPKGLHWIEASHQGS